MGIIEKIIPLENLLNWGIGLTLAHLYNVHKYTILNRNLWK